MKQGGGEIVVGRIPALACIHAGKREIIQAFIYNHAVHVEELIGLLPSNKIQWVDKRELDKISQGVHHQGVILKVTPLPIIELRDWLIKHHEPQCALIVLDSITDPMNFGAIIRSAAAFGAGGVLFPKNRAAPVTPSVIKAAAGGAEYIDLVQATNLANALQLIKREGFWVAALDAKAEKHLWDHNLSGRIAILVGSEGYGIRPLVKRQADFAMAIPMTGKLGSLNASVSIGVALAEWVRQSSGNTDSDLR